MSASSFGSDLLNKRRSEARLIGVNEGQANDKQSCGGYIDDVASRNSSECTYFSVNYTILYQKRLSSSVSLPRRIYQIYRRISKQSNHSVTSSGILPFYPNSELCSWIVRELKQGWKDRRLDHETNRVIDPSESTMATRRDRLQSGGSESRDFRETPGKLRSASTLLRVSPPRIDFMLDRA